jgi:hypothetical protein
MCRMMLEIKQPMLVQKGKEYHLISGYREWQLALYKFDKTEKIHCQVVTDAPDSLLNEIAWHDAYGAALLYGISPKGMGQQCNQMVKNFDFLAVSKYCVSIRIDTHSCYSSI